MKGFTLIELLVSVAILSFIVIVVIAVFTSGQNVYTANTGMMEMQRVIRQSVGGMVQELRQSRAAAASAYTVTSWRDTQTPFAVSQ
jgi:uncharacterized protein (TIGR02599 family)